MLQRIALLLILYSFHYTILAQSDSASVLTGSSDSLSSTAPILNSRLSKVDSIKNNIQQRKDTAQRNLDSLNSKAIRVQGYARHKLDSAKSKIAQSTSQVNDNMKGVTKIASVDGKVQQLDVPVIDGQISSVGNIGPVEPADLNLPSDLKITTPAMDGINLSEPDISKIDGVDGLTENIPGIDGNVAEVKGFEDDLQKIKEGVVTDPNELGDLAEQKLTEMPSVNEATQGITKATEEQAKYEAMIQRYRDQKLIQEEIDRKYKAVANDYIMQQTEKVNSAREKLNVSKYRKQGIGSVRDIFKKQSDELEGKSFYQRLVPGFNWQIYNKGFVSSDVSLQIGYRLTPRLTSGIGIVYRVGFDKKFDSFVKGLNTFGGRVYADMLIVKGMFLHGEFEALNQDASYTLYTNESISSRVYESNFGLGKRFNITRNIRGNIIAIYRVEYQGELPAANKINVRMGIDYAFRRAKKKLNGL